MAQKFRFNMAKIKNPFLVICKHCGEKDYRFSQTAVYCKECVEIYGQSYLRYHHKMKGEKNNIKMRKYFASNPEARRKNIEWTTRWKKRKDLYSLRNRRKNFPLNQPQ